MKKYIIAALALIISVWACTFNNNDNKIESNSTNTDELQKNAAQIFKPLPVQAIDSANPITDEKVILGKTLFFDPRLSLTGNNSCNSCHNINTFGVDNQATSTGDNGGKGSRNSPSVFNAALHIAQFWDGRAKNVEEQAGGPVLNPKEMAMPSKDFVVKRLDSVQKYKDMFKAAFPGDANPVSYDNLQKAIGAFERTLITPSAFDKYLAGDNTAINEEQKAGMKEFMNAGCTTCHSGVTVGGAMFQKFGLFADYRTLTGSVIKDEGKKDITKMDADKDYFKVPSLRNITKTGPYFHDGSVADLSKAVQIMGKLQLNKELTNDQTKKIIAFLETLTSDIPADVKNAPVIPGK